MGLVLMTHLIRAKITDLVVQRKPEPQCPLNGIFTNTDVAYSIHVKCKSVLIVQKRESTILYIFHFDYEYGRMFPLCTGKTSRF